MKQSLWPFWFRAYVMIPLLAFLYAVIPLFVWNFSPYALTHTTPTFLLGATDWGSGNIYTFTKIAYWIALVLGSIAITAVHAEEHGFLTSLWWKIRLSAWHFGAAFLIPAVLSIGGLSTDSVDMWLLFGYFLVGAFSILLLVTIAQQKGWPRFPFQYLLSSGALAWGVLPVSLGRP